MLQIPHMHLGCEGLKFQRTSDLLVYDEFRALLENKEKVRSNICGVKEEKNRYQQALDKVIC